MEFKNASELIEYLKNLESRVEKTEEVITSQSNSKDETSGEEEEEKKQDEEEVPSEEEINEIDALLNSK